MRVARLIVAAGPSSGFLWFTTTRDNPGVGAHIVVAMLVIYSFCILLGRQSGVGGGGGGGDDGGGGGGGVPRGARLACWQDRS